MAGDGATMKREGSPLFGLPPRKRFKVLEQQRREREAAAQGGGGGAKLVRSGDTHCSDITNAMLRPPPPAAAAIATASPKKLSSKGFKVLEKQKQKQQQWKLQECLRAMPPPPAVKLNAAQKLPLLPQVVPDRVQPEAVKKEKEKLKLKLQVVQQLEPLRQSVSKKEAPTRFLSTEKAREAHCVAAGGPPPVRQPGSGDSLHKTSAAAKRCGRPQERDVKTKEKHRLKWEDARRGHASMPFVEVAEIWMGAAEQSAATSGGTHVKAPQEIGANEKPQGLVQDDRLCTVQMRSSATAVAVPASLATVEDVTLIVAKVQLAAASVDAMAKKEDPLPSAAATVVEASTEQNNPDSGDDRMCKSAMEGAATGTYSFLPAEEEGRVDIAEEEGRQTGFPDHMDTGAESAMAAEVEIVHPAEVLCSLASGPDALKKEAMGEKNEEESQKFSTTPCAEEGAELPVAAVRAATAASMVHHDDLGETKYAMTVEEEYKQQQQQQQVTPREVSKDLMLAEEVSIAHTLQHAGAHHVDGMDITPVAVEEIGVVNLNNGAEGNAGESCAWRPPLPPSQQEQAEEVTAVNAESTAVVAGPMRPIKEEKQDEKERAAVTTLSGLLAVKREGEMKVVPEEQEESCVPRKASAKRDRFLLADIDERAAKLFKRMFEREGSEWGDGGEAGALLEVAHDLPKADENPARAMEVDMEEAAAATLPQPVLSEEPSPSSDGCLVDEAKSEELGRGQLSTLLPGDVNVETIEHHIPHGAATAAEMFLLPAEVTLDRATEGQEVETGSPLDYCLSTRVESPPLSGSSERESDGEEEQQQPGGGGVDVCKSSKQDSDWDEDLDDEEEFPEFTFGKRSGITQRVNAPPGTRHPLGAAKPAVAVLHSTDVEEEEEDGVCDVCQSSDAEPSDPIVFCDGCDVAVHANCYGNPLRRGVPDGDWFCAQCQSRSPGSRTCCLCPATEGAMKQTTDGKWAHISCAVFVPEVFFHSADEREPINTSHVPSRRWDAVCSLCHSTGGACVDCTEKGCPSSFHISCGLKRDLAMEYRSGRGGAIVISFCEAHTARWNQQQESKERTKYKIVSREPRMPTQRCKGQPLPRD